MFIFQNKQNNLNSPQEKKAQQQKKVPAMKKLKTKGLHFYDTIIYLTISPIAKLLYNSCSFSLQVKESKLKHASLCDRFQIPLNFNVVNNRMYIFR